MAQCPSLPKCPFFNDKMSGAPALADMMKKRYCQGDNSTCARWVVFQKNGPGSVPIDLFPNQMDKAHALIH